MAWKWIDPRTEDGAGHVNNADSYEGVATRPFDT
jgi:hypothetical protein